MKDVLHEGRASEKDVYEHANDYVRSKSCRWISKYACGTLCRTLALSQRRDLRHRASEVSTSIRLQHRRRGEARLIARTGRVVYVDQ